MVWPDLVPEVFCTTDCHVTIYREGISEDGEPMNVLDVDLKCNYQDKAKKIFTKEQKLVQVTGSAYFHGDIAPDVSVISGGEFTVFDVTREILQGTKARNPDGTVNYTLLEVI